MEQYLGESVPKLGFGLMRLPQKDGAIDVEQTAQMANAFLEAGFRYFDTSWGYPGSEDAFKLAIGDRHPRESYLLATKCPAWMAKDREEARNMLPVSLERTGAGYIDFYLLHNLGEGRTHFFDDYDMWTLAQEWKAQGLVKHVGFSFHDKAAVLEEILKAHPEMEFVQLQINYADWENPTIESKLCYEVARKYNKPIVIMEPVKGGNLAHIPEKAGEVFKEVHPEMSIPSWGVRFSASLPGVITVLSGMSSVVQMEDNLSFMRNFAPLDQKEQEAVVKVREILNTFKTIPCTSCKYCMEVCPNEIAIPGTFEAMNMYEMYGDLGKAKHKYSWNTDSHGLKKASQCVSCGTCEMACPQHIHIREELVRGVKMLEE